MSESRESSRPGADSRTDEGATGDGAKPYLSRPLRGVSILVVDDEADTRELLVYMLEACGACVHEAEGPTAARRILATHTPSLIISDIGMPDEDGYSFLEGVRALSDREKRKIPAIALTAFTRQQDRARAHRAGFDAHLAKPIQPRALTQVASQLAVRPFVLG